MEKQRYLEIYALAFVIFIDTMSIGLVFPLFAVLFNDPHGILPSTTSLETRSLLYTLIISVPMFALLFGSPILGELSDRWGRRFVLLISLAGVFFSCLLSVFSLYLASVTLLFISRVMIALFDGSQAIAQAAIVDISTSETKVKNMSLMTLAGTIGFILGPLLGGVLADNNIYHGFNYETPFWASAGLALFNFFLLKALFKETRVLTPRPPESWGTIFIRLGKSFVDKRYWRFTLVFIINQFVWAGVFQACNLLLADRYGYTAGQLGVYASYIAILFTLFLTLILRILLKHISRLALARWGIASITVALCWYTYSAGSLFSVWAAMIPLAMGMAMSYNTLLALFSDSVTENEQGKVMGMTVGLAAIGWLLAGVYTGHFVTVDYRAVFAGQAVISLIGLLLLARRT